jgi:SPP1 gp7 family putative phage head morphogenesis protein
MAKQIESWAKLHARSERRLAKTIRKFFREQDARILDTLGPQLLTVNLDLFFRPEDEAELFWKAIEDDWLTFNAIGAGRVLDQVPTASGAKAFSFKPFKLPSIVTTAISSALESVAKSSVWAGIQKNRAAAVAGAIRDSIGKGLSLPNIAKSIRSVLPKMGRAAAKAIARTETTGAINAGHQAGYDSLADSGLIELKEWLAILDRRVREEHHAANGQRVPAKGLFTVGGERCLFPGSLSLSVWNRINCRCTTAIVFAEVGKVRQTESGQTEAVVTVEGEETVVTLGAEESEEEFYL